MDAKETNIEKATHELHKKENKTVLNGQLSPISPTIQFRRTRYVGHCKRSKDELISDIPLWTFRHIPAWLGRQSWS